MSSNTIYKRYSVSCIQCKIQISLSNFNRHINSKQCAMTVRNTNPIRVQSVISEQCVFCNKLYTSKIGLGNHQARCKANPNRKLQVQSEQAKLISKQKYAEWAINHYSDPANRLKVSSRMKQVVRDNPESYSSSNRGRTKQIVYNGVKFQGQWELDFYMWCERSSIQVHRSTEWFDYEWNGQRTYNPDFFLPELHVYVEVKGYETDRDRAKWECFPQPIIIVRRSEIERIRSNSFTVDMLLARQSIMVLRVGNAPTPIDYESTVPL